MKPAISEAETQVMEVLWAASTPVAADAVATRLQDRTEWQLSTVKTLLGRLVSQAGHPRRRRGARGARATAQGAGR